MIAKIAIQTTRNGTEESMTSSMHLGQAAQAPGIEDSQLDLAASILDFERASSTGSWDYLLPAIDSSPPQSRTRRFIQRIRGGEGPEDTQPEVHQLTANELKEFLCEKQVDLSTQHTRVLRDPDSLFSVTADSSGHSKKQVCRPFEDLDAALSYIVTIINDARGERRSIWLHQTPPEKKESYAAHAVSKKGLSWNIVAQSEIEGAISEGVDRRDEADRAMARTATASGRQPLGRALAAVKSIFK